MTKPYIDQFLYLVETNEPLLKIREFIVELRKEGISKEELYDELQNLRSKLNDEQEDTILEVMDFLVSWCVPSLRIE